MSRRVTREDCLHEAHRLLTSMAGPVDWQQAQALQAQAWIALARELEKGSIRA